MKVAKWGNSLAIRIPADVASALGLKEGDDVTLRGASSDEIAIMSEENRRADALQRLRSLRGAFPAGFKINRDEDNER